MPSEASVGAPGPTSGALKKGLSVTQVEAILGPAASASTEDRDGLEVNVREYVVEGQRVTTQFVGGVLIDCAIRPAG